MLALRAAAALLAAEPGRRSLAAIAAAVAFDDPPLPLDASALAALGLPDGIADAAVIGGRGATRALLLHARAPLRDVVRATASALARHAPQLLWLLVAEDASGTTRAIATWNPDRATPRVALLLLDRERVMDSDAETLCALSAVVDGSETLRHARWLEVLGREALTRRFYRTLASIVDGAADTLPRRIADDDRRTLALLATSRLVFLAFLEAKGWLDGDRDFLANRFVEAIAAGGGIHRRVIDPLFFGTLNTPPSARAPRARGFGRLPYLNGGLFTRSPLERRWRATRFPDEALTPVVDDLLSRYRLTTREQAVGLSEAAVDPEMLGRAFETLMASRERRTSGAFYTPHQIVAEATSEALVSYVASQGMRDDAARTLVGSGEADVGDRARAASALSALRLVDPACGSGAFLVHALERVADLRARCGAPGDPSTLRRETLARSIFGVDSNPTAVWLCELRLWLAALIDEERDDPLEVPPLPNLDHNIRVGDSLSGMGLHDAPRGDGRKVEALRLRYARATGRRKQVLGAELDRNQRCAVLRELDASIAAANHQRRERVVAARSRDLFGGRAETASPSATVLRGRVRALRELREAVRRGAAMPFSWGAAFPDVAARGGFDVAIGNPPWVRLHNIPERSRDRLRREFEVFRHASWEAGAEGAGVRRGFAAQIDLAALFVERATQLLRPTGTLALLLPAKLWRSLAGGGVRRLLVRRAPPRLIDDWSESAVAFDAAVYPSLLVARSDGGGGTVECVLRHRHESLRWSIPRATLPLDDTDGSPWIVAPGPVRDGFDRMRARGIPLAATPFGRPRLGIKCGCNEAFVIAGETTHVERDVLRPIVRGETLTPWRVSPTERIVWTHDDEGAPLEGLPQGALRHLAPHRRALAARSDARASRHWWSLFRVEGALPGAPRVVWADVGRVPRAACLAADDTTLALNSCYVARAPSCDDALALTALLNSPLIAAWLALLAEPARGGYRRFLGWTMALLPIPRDWVRARALLAPLAIRAMEGDVPPLDLLLDASVRAFHLRASDVAPLVEWTHR